MTAPDHWRPSLGLVLGGALAATLLLSFAGLVALRYLGPVIGFRAAAVLLALVITAATAVLGWLLVRLLLRPIRALEHYAEAQQNGAGAQPPVHFGTHELRATARRVIAMAEALRDREATVRAYTDHITHELRTPVAGIRAAVELIEDSDGLPRDARALASQIDGARRQLEDQLDSLRRAALARETRYLGHATLGGVLPGLAKDWPGLTLGVTGAELSVPLAQEGLALVLGQLLRNAAEHGATEVSLRVTGDRGARAIDVTDNGRGISAGNAPAIFDPFFTTRRETGGTGMGLTVVRNILRAHRADIVLLRGETGASFRIGFDLEGP